MSIPGMDNRFPAITVWQPWATLIAIGAKPFEFRGHARTGEFRGWRIAIQAGARPARKTEIRELLVNLNGPNWKSTGLLREPAIELLEAFVGNPKGMLHSCIVCTALLGKPIRNAALDAAMGTAGLINDSDRGQHTKYGWPLSDINTLEPPVFAAGKQGWWWVRLPEGTR